MIVTCPSCSSRFQYDESRFKGAPSKRFQCTACSAIFDVDSPYGAPKGDGAKNESLRRSAAPAQQGGGAAGGIGAEGGQAALAPRKAPDPADPFGEDEFDPMPFGGAGLFGGGLQKRKGASLAFLTGPKSSTAIELANSRTVIGRDEGDIMTMDPETSKRHAMIEIMNDGTVWITDLGSTNGTIINGRPIASTAQLHDRQEFTCGKSAFMIMIDKD